ncbi:MULTISPECIES: methyl-accepting chemotaxis protein [Nitrincola]|uniref:Methyl-accepting chemotaxis protein 4 n=1 Tax=Nitrincola nitratireducens TaxID=1229521 RepID=W9V2F5_9GAMM|nr:MULTISPECIES: methyl-accepting chemotaxis protein [Nitrincola]EXJ11126.1 Methyl-accepting chemotaxis protein 4 [Nitrincola nitratireducens]
MFFNVHSVKNQMRLLVLVFLVVVLALLSFALYGFKYKAFQFEDNYNRRMVPLYEVERIGGLMEQIRTELLLSIQHNPTGQFASMHDHATSLHTGRVKASIAEIDRLWSHFMSVYHGTEATQLANQFQTAYQQYLTDAVQPTVGFLESGEYVKANLHILRSVNPLYAQADKARDALSDRKLRGAQEAKENLDQLSSRLTTQLIVLSLTGLLIALFVAWRVISRFKKGVADLDSIADCLANGDFRDHPSSHQSASDEFGEMIRRFIATRTKLSQMARQIGEAGLSLAELADHGSVVAEQASRGIQKQRMETDMVATAMCEMNATVHDVAKNAANAAASANEADRKAKEGRAVVTETAQGMEQLAQEVESAALVINDLSEDARKIGSVVDVIRDIAEQTNLLALNAAIEAARAGEQGRGFAVVADEVRSLASRTQDSTREIQSMVSHLQEAALRSTQVMRSGETKAQEGVVHSTKAREALDEIMSAIDAINDMNTQIASAAEEQSAVADEMNENLNRINTAADETSQASELTAQSSRQIAEYADKLKSIVNQLKF